MNLDRLREHIVLVNNGSGCIIQPVGDAEHSYILTAKHVVDENLEEIKIIRFERTDGGHWKEFPIPIDRLQLKDNYFPSPDTEVDIAIIRIKRIDGLNDLIGFENLESNREDYVLAGYPNARRTDSNKAGYRSDEKTVIKESKSYGLHEAKVPDNPSLEEVQGQSGGAIVKLWEGKGLVAGIQIKMVDGQENLGAVEFTSFEFFQKLTKRYEYKLSPLPSAKSLDDIKVSPIVVVDHGTKNKHLELRREFIPVNITNFKEDKDLITDLIQLIREDSERIILEDTKQKVLIDECNEELFRIKEIFPIDKDTRVKFRKRIGTVLFKILEKCDEEAMVRIMKSNNPDRLGIALNFRQIENSGNRENSFNSSSIPWEYLHYPGKIYSQGKVVKEGIAYAIAESMVIARRVDSSKDEPVLGPFREVEKIDIWYCLKNDFELYDDASDEKDDERINMTTVIKNKLEDYLRDSKNALAESGPADLEIAIQQSNLKLDESDGLKSGLIGQTMLRTTDPRPNIIHIVTDLNEVEESIQLAFVKAINEVTKKVKDEKNRLSLVIIQQSTRSHQKGQYRNYDKIANQILKETQNLSAVMTIPFTLNEHSQFFTIPSFYISLMRGFTLSEAYFRLTQEILECKSIALPILYLKQEDFAFSAGTSRKQTQEQGPRDRHSRTATNLSSSVSKPVTRDGLDK